MFHNSMSIETLSPKTKAAASAGTKSVLGIKGKLFFAFFGMATLTMVASGVAWYAFATIDASVEHVTDSLPRMAASLRLAERAAEIAATAPALIASVRQEDRQREKAGLDRKAKELAGLTPALRTAGISDQSVTALNRTEEEITAKLRELDAAVEQRLAAKTRKEMAISGLAAAHAKFLENLESLVDDATFELVLAGEAMSAQSQPAVTKPIDVDVDALYVLLALRAEGNLAVGVLTEAAGVLDGSALQPLRERFIAAVGHLDRLLARLPETATSRGAGDDTEALLAFGGGERSIFDARRDELHQGTTAQQALEASGTLALRLGNEVAALVTAAQRASDAAAIRSAEAIRTGKVLLLIIAALSIIGGSVIMLQYVEPRVVRPIKSITDAMAALAAGNTTVAIPGRERRDEIGQMAEALAIFRDTAVEIDEKNLREIAAARQRLIDAIESSSEGFALFDNEDRLVLCNSHFRDLYPGLAEVIVPGVPFGTIARAAVERCVHRGPGTSAEDWLERRVAQHQSPSDPTLQRQRDGRWIQINERRTQDGGTVGVYMDVSEIKRTEQELLATQARLTYLLTASPSLICSFQVGGRNAPTFISENVRDLLGYEPSEYLAGPEFWLEHVHPDDRDRVLSEFSRLLATGRNIVEYRFRRKDGSYRWVRDEQRLVRNERGEPLEVVESWSDVTERKTAEAAVAAAQARLDHLLAHTPAVIYSLAATGNYAPTFVSANIRRLLGYEPDEFLVHSDFWRNCVHPDDLPRVAEEFPRVFQVGHHTYEYRLRRHDGTYCWMSDQLHLICDADGTPIEVIGAWSDISARKLAEEARHETEQRLVDAIESIGEGFAFYDAEDRLRLCNARYREMLHAGGKEVTVGMSFESILQQVVADGRIRDADAVGAPVWIEERLARHRNPGAPIMQRRSDGRWVQVSERRIIGGGTVAVYSDLTELKENEERAVQAHRLILESLQYASRIQSAMLPTRQTLAAATRDYFLIWEPRDIVGGDFFWFHRTSRGYYIIVGDCTGHGVPGAFMTLIACGLLDRHLHALEDPPPSLLLSTIDRDLRTMLGQDRGLKGETDDGFDAGVCFVSDAERRLVFAGAHLSLWRAHDGELDEIKGDRIGIGNRRMPEEARFRDISLDLADDEAFYLATDGLIEQIGGKRHRAFGRKRFVDVVTQCRGRSMTEQRDALRAALANHQGAERRRDDVTVLGFVALGG